MLGAGAAVGAAWSAARGWLTPAVLFVAINLVVATIAVASRLMAPPGGDEAAAGERVGWALLRAPSLAVDRLLRSSLSFSRLGLAGAEDRDDAQAQSVVFDAAAGGASAPDPALQPPPAAETEREEAHIERSRSEAAAQAAHANNKRRRRRAVAEEEPAAAAEGGGRGGAGGGGGGRPRRRLHPAVPGAAAAAAPRLHPPLPGHAPPHRQCAA